MSIVSHLNNDQMNTLMLLIGILLGKIHSSVSNARKKKVDG